MSGFNNNYNRGGNYRQNGGQGFQGGAQGQGNATQNGDMTVYTTPQNCRQCGTNMTYKPNQKGTGAYFICPQKCPGYLKSVPGLSLGYPQGQQPQPHFPQQGQVPAHQSIVVNPPAPFGGQIQVNPDDIPQENEFQETVNQKLDEIYKQVSILVKAQQKPAPTSTEAPLPPAKKQKVEVLWICTCGATEETQWQCRCYCNYF